MGVMDETKPGRVSRRLKFVQALMGVGAMTLFALPYLRRTHGARKLDPRLRYLFVANHVSLLDTILLGGLCWRYGCYPILVLGDRAVWHASWVRRMLSRPIGFLLERGKLNPGRIRELKAFAHEGGVHHLVVFPEGTRGDGLHVAACQPGIYYIAQESRLPIVPVYFHNMQMVSTKNGPFHPISGLRKIEVHFGAPIPPSAYLSLPQDEFRDFVRQSLVALQPTQPAEHWNPVPRQA
jgi:1-acyl-sn-glycerol-3-phosphate acyltransferase